MQRWEEVERWAVAQLAMFYMACPPSWCRPHVPPRPPAYVLRPYTCSPHVSGPSQSIPMHSMCLTCSDCPWPSPTCPNPCRCALQPTFSPASVMSHASSRSSCRMDEKMSAWVVLATNWIADGLMVHATAILCSTRASSARRWSNQEEQERGLGQTCNHREQQLFWGITSIILQSTRSHFSIW